MRVYIVSQSQTQVSLFMFTLEISCCLCASGIEHVLLLLHLLLDHLAYSGTYSCPLIAWILRVISSVSSRSRSCVTSSDGVFSTSMGSP